MKTYAIIENNKVVNTVVYEDDVIVTDRPECPLSAGIGFSYINGEFIDDRPISEAPITPQLSKEELIEMLNLASTQIKLLSA
jgi:hypothetical protein